MGNRNLCRTAGSYGVAPVYCEFSFTTNNTSAPLLTTVDGADIVASFSRSSAGVLVLTLKDAYAKVIYASADMDDAGAGDYATVGNITNEGTSTPLTITVRTRVAAGTLTDFTGRKVSVALRFRDSNITAFK